MKITFRVDSSRLMGAGHVVRCLTLANSLRERGEDVRFISRDHEGNVSKLISGEGFPLTVLPRPLIQFNKNDYKTWIGVPVPLDVEQTIEALGGEFQDLLVVDHYGIDAEWENQLRPHTKKILVIDDLFNRRHDCDFLLDQNFTLQEEKYTGLLSPNCIELLGAKFSMLRPEYRSLRGLAARRSFVGHKVLVFTSGSDPDNVTTKILASLSRPECQEFEVKVVIGAANIHKQSILEVASRRPRTTVLENLPHLAEVLLDCDVCIGASGTTTWERLCLGVPSLVVSLSENQIPIATALAHEGLINYLGHFDQITEESVATEIVRFSRDSHSMKQMSEKGMLLVDGHGVERVAQSVLPSEAEKVWLRPGRESNEQYDVLVNHTKIGETSLQRSGNTLVLKHDFDSSVFRDRYLNLFLHKLYRLVGTLGPRLLGERGQEIPALTFSCDSKSKVISIVSDGASWINDFIGDLVLAWLKQGHAVRWVHDVKDAGQGDFCFYLSCGQIVSREIRSRFKHNLVVHESELPKGKGWSPLTWQIIEGRSQVAITLFEAADKVDSGPIYAQDWMRFEGHELVDELRAAQAGVTFQLCRKFIDEFPSIVEKRTEQNGESTFYPRRTPKDSRLDLEKGIGEQIDSFRVADNVRYPVFFEARGYRYALAIKKVGKILENKQ